MSSPVYPALLMSSHQERMNPQDRTDLEKLCMLENRFQEDPANWDVAVALARTLHNLRRDKPALEIMQRIPLNVLNPPDRLFLASLLFCDCDIPKAVHTAVRGLVLPVIISMAAFSGFLWVSRKRRNP